MKKITAAAIVLITFLTMSYGQAPDNVQKSFKSAFPSANVIEWKMTGDKYKVTYTDVQNLQYNILYTKEGKIFSRESELASDNYPVTIKEYFVKYFPEEKAYKVWKVENEAENVTYYSPVKEAVIFFDKDGKFERREERTPENMKQE